MNAGPLTSILPRRPHLAQMSHQGRMNAEVVVEPGETEIVHHLMIVDVNQPYRYPGYSLAWKWEAAK